MKKPTVHIQIIIAPDTPQPLELVKALTDRSRGIYVTVEERNNTKFEHRLAFIERCEDDYISFINATDVISPGVYPALVKNIRDSTYAYAVDSEDTAPFTFDVGLNTCVTPCPFITRTDVAREVAKFLRSVDVVTAQYLYIDTVILSLCSMIGDGVPVPYMACTSKDADSLHIPHSLYRSYTRRLLKQAEATYSKTQQQPE